MVRYSSADMTLRPGDCGTLVPHNNKGGTLKGSSQDESLAADLGTMVINSDTEEEEDEDSTMKSRLLTLYGPNFFFVVFRDIT